MYAADDASRNGRNRRKGCIAVVGAGWAGCAAAVELTRRGYEVHLLESSRILGGRARCLRSHGPTARVGARSSLAEAAPEPAEDWESALDNGQHILLGAYSQSLRLMREVGVNLRDSFLRLPLQMRYPANTGGMNFLTAPLPAPLHLLTALLRTRGLGVADKMALARFTTTVRWMGWRLHQDCSVAALLEHYDQTARVTALLWRPLCLAALNTSPENASAQVFLNVLRDSLGARRAAADMLIPRVDLSTLFPTPAATFVQRQGGRVLLGARVTAVERVGESWRLIHAGSEATDLYDAVVLAAPEADTSRLLEKFKLELESTADLDVLTHEPIVTCYLQYDRTLRLPLPFFALTDDPTRRHWGQFVFDRGQLDTRQAGLLAVVISAASDAAALPQDALREAISQQLAHNFAQPTLNNPLRAKVVTEKRATFTCRPGLIRPLTTTGIAGLFRAGDYVASDYPATIESAVRSGIAAAENIEAM
ncbi:MAG: hydroxysqualene dehydroxylase HpnE [Pseudomonadota bacterium]